MEVWLASGRNINQMVTKLGFDGAVDFAQFSIEYDGVKFFDHLAWAELTEVAAALA